MYKLSGKSLERLKGVNPILIKIVLEGIKNSPYDFGIPALGGIRTAEEQQALFNKKVSKCDGYIKKSYHQTGKAFDIFVVINGKATWDKKYYLPVARHLQKIAKEKFNTDLTWGGDFKSFVDCPHFEIK
jgi:peptidoglycan L-alanyl-D-glutamate endopeptidase CwlK